MTASLDEYMTAKGVPPAQRVRIALWATEVTALRRCGGQWPILRWVGIHPVDLALVYSMSDLDQRWQIDGVPIWLRVAPKAALAYVARARDLPPAYRSPDVLRRLIFPRDVTRFLEEHVEVPV